MTRENLKLKRVDKLAKLNILKDKLETQLNSKDNLLTHFYGGMVGFKKGLAKKKHTEGVEKEAKSYRTLIKIREDIKNLEIMMVEKPVKKEISPNSFKIGQRVLHLGMSLYGTVTRINKKTVSLQFETFKGAYPTSLISSRN